MHDGKKLSAGWATLKFVCFFPPLPSVNASQINLTGVRQVCFSRPKPSAAEPPKKRPQCLCPRTRTQRQPERDAHWVAASFTAPFSLVFVRQPASDEKM